VVEMSKCPECGNEIDYLMVYVVEMHEYTFMLMKEKQLDNVRYEETDAWIGDFMDFKCPECGKTLFYSEEEAKMFLKS
jgi:hypothetical protein